MFDNATAVDSHIYRDIFSTDAMRHVWSDRSRIQRYLDVERALAEAQAELNAMPARAAQEVAAHGDVDQLDFDQLKAATEHVGYPVLPVVQQLTSLCADNLGQWAHWGATTQDVTDTATVLQIRDGLDLVKAHVDSVAGALADLAKRYRSTQMVGRSNLQEAVPTTFGYKAAVWLAGIERQRQRLEQLRERVLIGEFGGAVGTLASLGPDGLAVQAGLLGKLGLAQPPIAWHTVRDTVAETGTFLALLTGSLTKIATDVKIMMATEIAEVQEPDGGGGRGASSTMPQKRNPISCAYITACATMVRQQATALLTAMDADLERATGTWEIEWLALPEVFCYSAGALSQTSFMLSGLVVHPDAMLENLRSTDGLVNTEAVMMALAPVIGREIAHDALTRIVDKVTRGEGRLLDLLDHDQQVSSHLDRKTLERLLEPAQYLGLSTTFVDRVLAELAGNEEAASLKSV